LHAQGFIADHRHGGPELGAAELELLGPVAHVGGLPGIDVQRVGGLIEGGLFSHG
jgi:hypothetical protein